MLLLICLLGAVIMGSGMGAASAIVGSLVHPLVGLVAAVAAGAVLYMPTAWLLFWLSDRFVR